MANSVGCCGELYAYVRVQVRLVSSVWTNIIMIFVSQQQREEVLHSDLLQQSDHVVSGCLVDFLVVERGVFVEDDIADSVVFAHEDGVVGGEEHVLVDSFIASLKQVVAISRQQATRSFHIASSELPQRSGQCLIRTVDLTSVDPGGDHVLVLSRTGTGYEVGSAELEFRLSSEKQVVGRNGDVEAFRVSVGSQVDVVIQELSPNHERHRQTVLAPFNVPDHFANLIADVSWVRAILHWQTDSVGVTIWTSSLEKTAFGSPESVVEVVVGSVVVPVDQGETADRVGIGNGSDGQCRE